jgi:mRNA interferase RelE/StbE
MSLFPGRKREGMYKILLHNKAAKEYKKLNDKSIARISKAIDTLKENPFYGKDIKRLRGELKGKYRLRVGEYRIVYRVEEKEEIVILEDIKLRGLSQSK